MGFEAQLDIYTHTCFGQSHSDKTNTIFGCFGLLIYNYNWHFYARTFLLLAIGSRRSLHGALIFADARGDDGVHFKEATVGNGVVKVALLAASTQLLGVEFHPVSFNRCNRIENQGTSLSRKVS